VHVQRARLPWRGLRRWNAVAHGPRGGLSGALGVGFGTGIRCLRAAASTAGVSGAILLPTTLGIPDGFRRHHAGQTVVDTRFMKNGVVWGIVSNHPDKAMDSQGTLTIRKGR